MKIHPKKKALILILLFISISSFTKDRDHYTKSRIIKKIAMIIVPGNVFNIIYENKSYKFYFNKSLIIEFIKSKEFKYKNDVKDALNNLTPKIGTINYYDPYWLINLHPVRYKLDSIGYSAIDYDKYLRICNQFHIIVWEYLKKGEFKIFDKKKKNYINADYIYLVETKTTIPDNTERNQSYQLANKKVLLKTLVEAIEWFPSTTDIQNTENKIETFDDIK